MDGCVIVCYSMSYFVVLLSILQSIFGMVVRSFGILYLLLLERYQTSATVAAWVGAVNLLIYGLTGRITLQNVEFVTGNYKIPLFSVVFI